MISSPKYHKQQGALVFIAQVAVVHPPWPFEYCLWCCMLQLGGLQLQAFGKCFKSRVDLLILKKPRGILKDFTWEIFWDEFLGRKVSILRKFIDIFWQGKQPMRCLAFNFHFCFPFSWLPGKPSHSRCC